MIDTAPVFELTTNERNSALWVRLMGHFKEKLEAARSKNDTPQGVEATAALRGQIAVYKGLIALDKEQFILVS